KAVAVEELADRDAIDLSRCYAYPDSANDLQLLKSVGRPCVIIPDRKLRREAKAMGWRIREYRTTRQALLLAAKAGFAIVSGLLGWRVIRRLKTHRRT